MAKKSELSVLREQVELAKLRVEEQRVKAEAKVLESATTYYTNYIDPLERLIGPEGKLWLPSGPGAQAGQLGPTGIDLDSERQAARRICETNPFAINAMTNFVNFIIGDGIQWRAVAKKGLDPESPDIKRLQPIVQERIDAWMEDNDWIERERELCKREFRDGEWFVRKFGPVVRGVEPNMVFQPANDRDENHLLGVMTAPMDVETVLGYLVNEVPVSALEMFHRKANVDRNVKRGSPYVYGMREELDFAKRLLFNVATVTTIQASIAMIRKFDPMVSKGQVDDFVSRSKQKTVTSTDQNMTVRMQRFLPGQILNESASMQYDFPMMNVQAAQFEIALQMILRACAARMSMHESIFSAFDSKGSFASALVSESPTYKNLKAIQSSVVRTEDKIITMCVLDEGIIAGDLPANVVEFIDIQGEPHDIESHDTEKDARRDSGLQADRILSPQTRSQRMGLDYEREQQNFKEHDEATGAGQEPRLPIEPDEEEMMRRAMMKRGKMPGMPAGV